MGRRGILNVTSQKKHDTIIGINLDGSTEDVGGVAINSASVAPIIYGYCPTFRYQFNGDSYTLRNSSAVYFRGWREQHVFRQPANAVPFSWRRLVVGSNLPITGTYQVASADASTQYRPKYPNQTAVYAALEVFFQGTKGVDWTSEMTAKPDTNRCQVYYDKTRRITPHVAAGGMTNFKMWHGINKNIIYNDEEASSQITSSGWASPGPRNQNIFVFDMFESATAATNQMAWASNTTVFWHER